LPSASTASTALIRVRPIRSRRVVANHALIFADGIEIGPVWAKALGVAFRAAHPNLRAA
jgi:hypothetical protein